MQEKEIATIEDDSTEGLADTPGNVPVLAYYSVLDQLHQDCEPAESSLKYILEHVREGIPELDVALKRMRDCGDPHRRRWLKEHLLPGFVMGFYKNSYAHPTYCRQTPGMIVELKDIEEGQLSEAFQKICSMPQVYAAFRNPLGDGVTVILLFKKVLRGIGAFPGNPLPDAYKDLYRYYAKRLFEVEVVDEESAEVNRVCFLTHDPELFINPSPEFLDPEQDAQAIDRFSGKSSMADFYAAHRKAEEAEAEERRKREELRRKDPERYRLLYEGGDLDDLLF